MLEKTIFEKIIDREIPAEIIYEDRKVISFLNAFPFDRGHLLIVPKTPYKTIFDMSEDDFLYLQKIIYKIAKKIRKKTGKDIVIYQRNGLDAGQEIPHVHFHILPRYNSEKKKALFNDLDCKNITNTDRVFFAKLFKF